MFMKDSTILVTGGSGYIGNNLIKKLTKKDCKIISINNSNLPNICPHPNIDNFFCDLEDQEALNEIIKKQEIDYVFHMAAKSNASPSHNESYNSIRFNVNSTLNILENIRHKKVKRFFFTSSSKVYSGNKSISYDEDAILNPDEVYGLSKLCCEKIIHTYAKNYKISSIALRLGSVFGEYDSNFSHLVPSIIDSLVNSKKIILKNQTSKILDLVYLDHLSDFMLCENNKTIKNIFKVINFSSYQVSIEEIINFLEDISKQKLIYEIQEEANHKSSALMSLNVLEKISSNFTIPSLDKALKETYSNFIKFNKSI